ncbi:amino acid ABC transporter permease [Pseudomonas alloputida]|uniref:amino acid ABC transporter permease n=1 Tax=Pseudomonas TaxID=286 RepID=UPI000EB576A3|nr:amino acid ABC transporter permease [Pseudomonas inefficax]WNN41328.1 amino acid ABC transporter permease [Pseudomonas inefficax]
MDNFDFSVVFEYRDALLAGLWVSIQITILAGILGTIGGFLISLGRSSNLAPLRWICIGFVEIIRGTPVLILLFWVFFCLPIILGMEIGTFTSSLIALTAYMAASTSEAFRSALKSIPNEHYDACVALGLSRLTRSIYVVAPQAFIRAIPNLLSSNLSLFKEGALVSAVGMADLMFAAQNISNVTARPIEILTIAALIYLILGSALAQLVTFIERRINQKIAA